MPTERLMAIVNGRRMGVLERTGQRVTLTYDPTWREAEGAFPMSLSMPLAMEQHTASTVLPFLWGLLPDNHDVLARWGRRFGASPRNPFKLLAHVGEDCAGAVQFVTTEREDAVRAGPPTRPEWLTERQVAERLRVLGQDASAGRLATDTGQFSLPGAQRKTALYWDGKRWGVPAGAMPTTHILKPTLPDFDGHAENEHICLALARALGIPAATSRVERFEEQVAIVVDRFDRVQQDGVYRRVHQEDFCQACGIHPDRKYENQGGPGAVAIVQTLRENSRMADIDVTVFLQALVFNWLIGGTDAHAKNYGVLFGGGAHVRLAPLYDVASALPYYPTGLRKLKLAMRVGGEYALLRVSGVHWQRLAADARIAPEEMEVVINQLCAALPDTYAKVREAARESGLSHSILDTLGTLIRERVAWVSQGARTQ
ncbi:MAG: type II toxin-antitoxin system HipA family toxin [Gemmatimonadota bacterium]